MKYMLMFYLDQTEFDSRTDPKTKDAFWGRFIPYLKAVREAGIFLAELDLSRRILPRRYEFSMASV